MSFATISRDWERLNPRAAAPELALNPPGPGRPPDEPPPLRPNEPMPSRPGAPIEEPMAPTPPTPSPHPTEPMQPPPIG
jgi:hypothetical protein